jgi:hypothetical protein
MERLSRLAWLTTLFLAEHICFALSLLSIMPPVPSDKEDIVEILVTPTNLYFRIAVASVLMFLSRITAIARKREDISGLLFKMIILVTLSFHLQYLLYQYAITAGLSVD